jgi:hypothetical protein
VTSQSVDGTSSAQEMAAQAPAAEETDEMEGAGGGAKGADGGVENKVVFIGSDVDRSWTQYFDVVEVAPPSLPASPSPPWLRWLQRSSPTWPVW